MLMKQHQQSTPCTAAEAIEHRVEATVDLEEEVEATVGLVEEVSKKTYFSTKCTISQIRPNH